MAKLREIRRGAGELEKKLKTSRRKKEEKRREEGEAGRMPTVP
jgi:hypothetical protein